MDAFNFIVDNVVVFLGTFVGQFLQLFVSLTIRKGESGGGQARRDARRAHLHPGEQQPARLPGRHARHHGAKHLRHARRTQTRPLL